jgi:DNA-binding MarR family transcriptional regulator/GNAT superfamily N-acetyltransferase
MTGPATAAQTDDARDIDARGTTGPTPAEVTEVRAFNRFYTNVIGVLHGMYLDTPYTLTESRLLYEIVRSGTAEVSWLRQALDIDAGYLSRVLTRFESDGLVTRHRSASDARRQDIRATDAGRAAVAQLDERAVVQAGALLGGVDRGRLLDAMRVITEVLAPAGERSVALRPLAAGDLGWVLQRHGTVYAAEFGWDTSFEDFCASIIGDYPALRDRAPGRAAGWIAEVNGVPAGSVFCVPDAEPPHGGAPNAVPGAGAPPTGASGADVPDAGALAGGQVARLRLLLVEPWARGLGLGAALVGRCLDFARAAGYQRIVLMTYDQLAAARRVYRAAGFTLDHEHPEDAFGQHMMCQTWSRDL